MAIVASELASLIKERTEGIDVPSEAISAFFGAISDYVGSNAEVKYNWSASDDPTTSFTGSLIMSGDLSLSFKNTPESALGSLSDSMASIVKTWKVKPAPGFSVTGGSVSTSGIPIKISMANTREAALLSVAKDIINGIKGSIPPVLRGSHNGHSGSTTGGTIV